MDFDLIDNLDENQLNELYDDTLDNDKLSINDKHWTCYAYIREPKGIISDIVTTKQYLPHVLWYSEWTGHINISHNEGYYAQYVSSNVKSYSPYTSYTKQIVCEQIYDCFDMIYEQNFKKAEHCGYTLQEIPPFYYSYEEFIEDTVKYSAGDPAFYVAAIRKAIAWNNLWRESEVKYFEFNYDCNLGNWDLFYRYERRNELNFNANIEVTKYVHVFYKTEFVVRDLRLGKIYINTYHRNSALLVNDDYGNMYVHMTCSR